MLSTEVKTSLLPTNSEPFSWADMSSPREAATLRTTQRWCLALGSFLVTGLSACGGTVSNPAAPSAVNATITGDLHVHGTLTVGNPATFATVIKENSVTIQRAGTDVVKIYEDPATREMIISLGEQGSVVLTDKGLKLMDGNVPVVQVAKLADLKKKPGLSADHVQTLFTDAGLMLFNMGQMRADFMTEQRVAPNGKKEPGVTELLFYMPDRDPVTFEPVRNPQTGGVAMKMVLALETHDGHSPGNSGNPETWTTMRMLNGAGATGGANSPIFEAFSIAPWSPIPGNQPYLSPGQSGIYFWAKDLPTTFQIRDGNRGDAEVGGITIDPKDLSNNSWSFGHSAVPVKEVKK